jgi:hypothetical protein
VAIEVRKVALAQRNEALSDRAVPAGEVCKARDEHGLAMRTPWQGVGKELDAVLDAILRVLGRRRQSGARAEPVKFVRRGSE